MLKTFAENASTHFHATHQFLHFLNEDISQIFRFEL